MILLTSLAERTESLGTSWDKNQPPPPWPPCTETFCSQDTIESARDQEMLQATALPLLINHPNPFWKPLDQVEFLELAFGQESFCSGGRPPE